MTTVWLFKPRSHGRKKEAARARNGAPLPGRPPSFHMPHRSASSALFPCGYAASFRRRSSSFVRGVWRLKFGGAAAGGGALQARAVCAACWAACARAVLLCSCGRCCGGVCAATLVAVGARAVGGARAVDAGRARWVPCGGRGRPRAVAVGGAWRYRAGGVRASPLFLCSRCRRCCRWCSAPWPQTCPPGGWCMLTVSPAARAARRHAGRRRCWRGVGGRCRSWP